MTSSPRRFRMTVCLLTLGLLCPPAPVSAGASAMKVQNVAQAVAVQTSQASAEPTPPKRDGNRINPCNDTASICTVEERLGTDPSQWLRWAEALIVCGALMMMGLYHLAVFVSRRNNLEAFSLGVYCLLRTANALCSGGSDWSIMLLLPKADRETLFVVGMSCLTLSFPFLQAYFLRLFPHQFPKWGLRALTLGAIACFFSGLFSKFGNAALSALYLYMLLVSLYSTVNLTRAIKARESGAATLLVGYLVVILAGINDVLLAKAVIHSVWLTPIGTLAFISCQSGLLARRFSDAFAAAKRLSGQLERQNAALNAEITERSRLEHKIAEISDEEKRFVSRALHDGLCQELTAARLHCSLLRSTDQQHGHSCELNRLSALLESAVDQAYELSHGLWPARQEIGDLSQALSELANELSTEHGIEIAVCSSESVESADATYNEHIFLIAKEALSNIIKHAQARSVLVSLRRLDSPHEIELTVDDDGTGLDSGKKTPGGLGRKIMAHHAQSINAALSFTNREHGGTRVRLLVPVGRQVSN